ncbi:Fic family protein [Candidatus Saccharibacteria bacterium]|nr:Fic family protein [Candidatus Saccharibacteria bacterium]
MNNKFYLSLKQNTFLAKKLLVASIYGSAKLEGVNATFPETQTIIDGVNVAGVKLDDITVILNLRDAWRFVLSDINVPLSLDFICKINGYVSRNQSLEWGKLRTGEIGIAGTKHKPPIPAHKDVEKDLANIFAQGSATKQALDIMLYIMRSQLFWDGNKRTATIVANKVLIANGAGVLIVKEEDLLEFNQLLTEYYDTASGVALQQFLYDNCLVGM